jgi:16S rRNA (cytosine967-C5)-methyltransferase
MTARDYALIQLDDRDLPNWPLKPGQRFAKRTGAPGPAPPEDPRDRALAEQIFNGVIKNLLHLQHLIEHYAGRKLRNIDPLVQKVLAIALYQLRFLDRIPPSAAINEAVEQTRRFRRPKAAGFVNAVLRNAQRQPHPPLPDPANDPERYAAIALSHPPEVYQRLRGLVEDDAIALQLCRHNNLEPPTIVRLFRGVNVEQLEAEGVSIEPHEQQGMYIVHPARRPILAHWAGQGLAQVQDPTSALVIEHADIRPGQIILDRCAGLGTKTLQMRDLLGDTGSITAVDPNHARCDALRKLLATRNLQNITVFETDRLARIESQIPRHFDRALIDAPCSNSGVLARRLEARYHQAPRALKSLEQLQNMILDDTAPFLAPGGRLIYSTCSIWPEENQQMMQRFLARHPHFRQIEERFTLPSTDPAAARYHDGGYLAVLRRDS